MVKQIYVEHLLVNYITIFSVEGGNITNYYIYEEGVKSLFSIYIGSIVEYHENTDSFLVDVGHFKGNVSRILVEKAFTNLKIEDVKDYYNLTLVVQLIKLYKGRKLPAFSTNICLVNQFFITFPYQKFNTVYLSHKINNYDNRSKFMKILNGYKKQNLFKYKTIVRNKLFGQEENIVSYRVLVELWNEISEKINLLQANGEVGLVHFFDYIIYQVFDLLGKEDSLFINNHQIYDKAKALCKIYKYRNVIKFSKKTFLNPTFMRSIKTIHNRDIFSNGVRITFDKTEAGTFVDVNTSFFKKNSTEENLGFEVNNKALKEISKQLVLRNICGIIVVDLINATSEIYLQLTRLFKEYVSKDKNYVRFEPINSFGLLCITRERNNFELSDLTHANSNENLADLSSNLNLKFLAYLLALEIVSSKYNKLSINSRLYNHFMEYVPLIGKFRKVDINIDQNINTYILSTA